MLIVDHVLMRPSTYLASSLKNMVRFNLNVLFVRVHLEDVLIM